MIKFPDNFDPTLAYLLGQVHGAYRVYEQTKSPEDLDRLLFCLARYDDYILEKEPKS